MWVTLHVCCCAGNESWGGRSGTCLCASLSAASDFASPHTRAGRTAGTSEVERRMCVVGKSGQTTLLRSACSPPIRFLGALAPAGPEGGCIVMRKLYLVWLPILLVCFAAVAANAQSFQIQCPTRTITHPVAANNDAEPVYTAPTYTGTSGYATSGAGHVNGAIKCQQISGGDGFATMGDGTQTYMFSFGPLSGLANIAHGLPGTESPTEFNLLYSGTLLPGDPATTGLNSFSFN